MIKKGEIITILAVLLFVYITDSAKAEINDVEITPDEPTTEDIITIGTFGIETSGPVTVIDTVVNITDSDIGLDLTLVVGPFAVITPWSYSEDIGRLPAGTYDLTVRAIVDSVVTDTYFKTFQVVPEPSMTLDGTGTEEDPWLIRSLDDFNEFAAIAYYWDDYTRLETDVNLAGQPYSTAVIAPDMNSSQDYFQGTAFTGVFDGNNHKIINLSIDDGGAGNDYLGIFGCINDGEVRNLGLEGGFVSGEHYVGSLVGENLGIVSNCYCTGDMSGYSCVSGLVGKNGIVGPFPTPPEKAGYIYNSYSKGSVQGDSFVGGIVGRNHYGTVSNCYSTGDVNGVYTVGGLVGDNYIQGSISNCFWDIDKQTHGVTESIGDNQGTAVNVTGRPTAEMQAESTFTNAGWDFINVWDIGENQTYPYLRIYLAADLNKDGIVNFLDFAITANQWLEGGLIE